MPGIVFLVHLLTRAHQYGQYGHKSFIHQYSFIHTFIHSIHLPVRSIHSFISLFEEVQFSLPGTTEPLPGTFQPNAIVLSNVYYGKGIGTSHVPLYEGPTGSVTRTNMTNVDPPRNIPVTNLRAAKTLYDRENAESTDAAPPTTVENTQIFLRPYLSAIPPSNVIPIIIPTTNSGWTSSFRYASRQTSFHSVATEVMSELNTAATHW